MKDNEKKSDKSKKIIIVLLILILIGILSFAFYYLKLKKDNQFGNLNIRQNQMSVNQKNMLNGNMQNNAAIIQEEATYELGDFTLNLADKDERRYMKANICLGYPKKAKKLAKELDEDKCILRDTINLELMSKTANDFDVKGIQKIKKDIVNKVNMDLTQGQIINVYFNNIIVQ